MRYLKNEQYIEFVLAHVVRPYQTLIGLPDEAIKSLAFEPVKNGALRLNYWDLILYVNTHEEWWHMVINRLGRIYKSIDFSFFPDEAFAWTLQKALIQEGVKGNNIFHDFNRHITPQPNNNQL